MLKTSLRPVFSICCVPHGLAVVHLCLGALRPSGCLLSTIDWLVTARFTTTMDPGSQRQRNPLHGGPAGRGEPCSVCLLRVLAGHASGPLFFAPAQSPRHKHPVLPAATPQCRATAWHWPRFSAPGSPAPRCHPPRCAPGRPAAGIWVAETQCPPPPACRWRSRRPGTA